MTAREELTGIILTADAGTLQKIVEAFEEVQRLKASGMLESFLREERKQ